MFSLSLTYIFPSFYPSFHPYSFIHSLINLSFFLSFFLSLTHSLTYSFTYLLVVFAKKKKKKEYSVSSFVEAWKLASLGDLILVGDLMSSVFVLNYKASSSSLEIVC